MYILLALLIVAVILWFVLKPKWAPKAPDTTAWTGKAGQASKEAAAKASQASKEAAAKARQASKEAAAKASLASKQATVKAGQMYQGLRGRFRFRNHTHDLAKQFKQWVAEAAPGSRAELYNGLPASADGFAAWLGGLPDKELAQFTKQVVRFCASVNFNLAWLTDAQVSREPELKRAVEDTVLLYSLTTWRANNVQQDVKGFFAYQAWLAKPNRHREFGQQLYAALVHGGAVTIPAELYLASEKERQAQAAASIRKAAEEDRVAFQAALRQVIGGGESTTAVAPAAAAPEPAPAAAAPEPAEPAASPQPTRRKVAMQGAAA